jgi:Tol biopolymer transport system component
LSRRAIIALILLTAIIAVCLLNSCRQSPTDSMPNYETFSQINVVNADGSGHRILAGDQARQPLPTSRSIIFRQGAQERQLYSIDYDGSNQTQLCPGIPVDHYALTPDGGRVFLSSLLFESNIYLNDLYLMNLDGSALQKLAPVRSFYGYPHLSPNLDEIAFCHYGSLGTINVDGTGIRYIKAMTDSTFCSYSLYADQTHIVYFEYKRERSSIRLYDKTNGEDRLLTTYSGGFPDYSRALVGSKLLFVDLDTIKILDINDSTVQTPATGYYASFSFDGARIVFADNKTIWTANSDGSNKLTIYAEEDSATSVSYPQFSWDNRNIVFLTSQTIASQ